jgi:hypothetical protein
LQKALLDESLHDVVLKTHDAESVTVISRDKA